MNGQKATRNQPLRQPSRTLAEAHQVLVQIRPKPRLGGAHPQDQRPAGPLQASMTQDRYLGRHLTYRQTADVLGKLKKSDGGSTSMGPDNQYDDVDGMG